MFGDRLKKLRESKHLKQSDLAKELGIGRTTLSNYELNNREPDFNTLGKIANYFNVSIDYLLGNSTEKDSSEMHEVDELEQEFEELRDKMKNISPSKRKKILKMIELFEEDEE